MSKLKIVTQTDNIEGKKTKVITDNWMDDCAWATLACAANHLTGTKYTSFDGVKWGEKVGRKVRDGLPDPSSLYQLVKAGPLAGIKVTYPKTWAAVEKALAAGAVILLNVEQAKKSGKGKEAYGVPVTLAQLKQIASSQGDAPHKRCLIAVK